MKNDISESLSAKEIFTMALELPDGPAREAWLREQCGQDVALRQKVDHLLAAAGQRDGTSPLDVMVDAFAPGDTLLSADVDGQAEPDTQPVPEGLERRKIGPYKLLEQIGQGGFGTVYMAEQTVPVRRKVALKILKPGMDSSEVIARFEAERQALAMMDHPNIARIYDGGTTDTGRPYFVMELVRGIPVTAYCDEARLTTDERLTLFIDICRAVQHAHQKGIIHRDLKPSNVLVTMHDDKAVVKVIDFGIAKALSQQLTDRTLFTGYQQMLGTPLYMSPEQAQMSGIDIDTRSDVYSLGVLLYELLTGTTPFDRASFTKASLDDMRRIIREVEPPRPSARITTMQAEARSTIADRRRIDQRRVSDQLRGELDWIVMKALEKDRNRRYESASAFARDVQRFLEDQPVFACPPTLVYRLGKLGRRNKVAFGIGFVVLCGLMVGVTGLTIANSMLSSSHRATQDALKQASDSAQLAQTRADAALASQQAAEEAQRQAELDRQQAEQHFTESFELVQRMVDKITEWNLSEQPNMEQYRVHLLEAADSALGKLQTSRPKDLRVLSLRSQVLASLAQEYTLLGRINDTLTTSELSVMIADELVKNSGPAAGNYRHLQWQLRYGQCFGLQRAGHSKEAAVVLQTALLNAEPELEKSPDNNDLRGQIINLLRTLSVLEAEIGQLADSRVHLQKACVTMGLPVGDDLQVIRRIADSELDQLLQKGFKPDQITGLLTAVAVEQAVPQKRIELLRQSLSVARNSAGESPTRMIRHQLAFDLVNASKWMRKDGNSEEAAAMDEEAVTILRRLTVDFPAMTTYSADLQRAQQSLIACLTDLKRYDDMLAHLNQMVDETPNDRNLYELRGQLYALHLNQAEKALPDFDRMIELSGDQVTAHHYQLRGNALTALGQTERARLDLDRAHEIKVAELDKRIAEDSNNGENYFARACFHDQQGDLLKALADYEKAIELQPKNWGYRDVYAGFLYWRHSSDRTLPNHRKGLVHAQIAVELQPENPRSWSLIAQGCYLVGDTTAGRRNFERSLEIDPLHPYGLNWLVLEQLQNGKLDEAYATAEKLVAIAPEDANNWWMLAEVHAARKQLDKAFEVFDKAITLAPYASHLLKERGELHASLRNDALALSDFDKAIELQPNTAYLYKSRAACNFRMARFEQALADLQMGLELTPDDVSNVTWIPAADVAACTHPNFREGILKLADRCVEVNKESPASLIARSQLLAGLGESEKAKQDLEAIISQTPDNYYQQYQLALLSAKLENMEGYKAQCQTLVDSTKATAEPIEKHFAAWTCALSTNAVNDYTNAIALGRAAVEAEPTNSQFLNGLGAILVRAGMYAEAKPYLEGTVHSADSEGTSKTYTHYFLALTEHHLGQVDAASAQLKAADELADKELAASPPWNRRLTIELLRQEAEVLIGDADK
jgi:serine/threonine protein kinase/Tfp pilus assembly protein PilF